MMNAKVSPNLISFITIRRGNWVMKISVFKRNYVMIVAQHYFETDQFFVKQFTHHDEAVNFIDMLALKDDYEN
jgi:hypothetical protein